MTPHSLSPQDLTALVEAASSRRGLPFELVSMIVAQESGGNPWAFRFEPAFFARYVDGKNSTRRSPCSLQTENMGRATSFGLMQVMGQTARELGFEQPYLTELCDPETGLDFGCLLLAKLAARFQARTDKWQAVCSAYNGGPGAVGEQGVYRNADYVEAMAKRLAQKGLGWESLS